MAASAKGKECDESSVSGRLLKELKKFMDEPDTLDFLNEIAAHRKDAPDLDYVSRYVLTCADHRWFYKRCRDIAKDSGLAFPASIHWRLQRLKASGRVIVVSVESCRGRPSDRLTVPKNQTSPMLLE